MNQTVPKKELRGFVSPPVYEHDLKILIVELEFV
jgi:hypothetical protein